MSDRTPEPYPVVQKVEQHIDSQIRDIIKYENREAYDDSGCFALHTMAAQIYAMGFDDGESAQAERERRQRYRDRSEA
jgi:hypothetical protein